MQLECVLSLLNENKTNEAPILVTAFQQKEIVFWLHFWTKISPKKSCNSFRKVGQSITQNLTPKYLPLSSAPHQSFS